MSHNSKKLALVALVALQSALMLAPGANSASYSPVAKNAARVLANRQAMVASQQANQASDPGSSVSGPVSTQTNEEALAYWTPDRLKASKPMPTPEPDVKAAHAHVAHQLAAQQAFTAPEAFAAPNLGERNPRIAIRRQAHLPNLVLAATANNATEHAVHAQVVANDAADHANDAQALANEEPGVTMHAVHAQVVANDAADHAQDAQTVADEAVRHATVMHAVAAVVNESQSQANQEEGEFFKNVAIVEDYKNSPNPTNGTLKAGYVEFKKAAEALRVHSKKYIDESLMAAVKAVSVLDILPNVTVESQSARAELTMAVNALRAALERV